MNVELYKLHLEAGKKFGEVKTCGNKTKFQTEEHCERAVQAHNIWKGRKHDVEAYPCAFCSNWHVGKVIPFEFLKEVVYGKE